MIKRWILAAAICGLLMPAMGFARVWRDQKGNTINADFVKVDRGMIYLKPANKYAPSTPFPFYDFSEADQDFVKGILEKQGQLDRIPPPPKNKDKPGQGAVPGNALPVTAVPNVGRIPGNVNVPTSPPGTIPDIPDSNFPRSSTIPIAVTPTVPPSSPTPVNAAPTVSPSNPSFPTTTTSPRPVPSSPRINPPLGPQFVETKQCMSCKKEIPLSSKVGQKCPHCGVFWSEETNQFGQVVNRTPNSSSRDWTTSRGAVRLAFLIGAFVIGGIVKLVRDSR